MYKLSFLLLSLISVSCMQKDQDIIEDDKKELIKTDIEFSDMSVREGISPAFIKFAADDVVLLREGKFPLLGIEQLKESFAKRKPGPVLEWKPWKADVSESGELGYTIGNWRLTTTDSTGKKEVIYGNYVSIWKKLEGKWKYVLDTGNNTPVPEKF